MKKFILFLLFVSVASTLNATVTRLELGHFKWRYDNGSIYTATQRAPQDVNTTVDKNNIIRLRFEVYVNVPRDFEGEDMGLYYSTLADSKENKWTRISSTSEHFQLATTSYYSESDIINDILDETHKLDSKLGYLIESTSEKDFIFDQKSSYELEYSIKATDEASYNTTYFFRYMDNRNKDGHKYKYEYDYDYGDNDDDKGNDYEYEHEYEYGHGNDKMDAWHRKWRHLPTLIVEVAPPTEILAIITTQAVTGIAITTATGNGTITSLGVPNPTAHGVVWSTTTNPTTSNSFTDLGGASAIGAFTSSMTSLSAATTYYVRAYATNAAGTVYGNEVSFTTLPEASAVTTQAVTDITINTATGNGTITSLGVPNPTAYGVVWSTITNPTTSNSFTDLGGASAIGAFTSSMTSLSAATTYYVRAYATNAAGTVYGNEVSFTTLPEASAVTTQAVTGIVITTATGNGTITSLGVPNPTAYGVVWSTSTNPTTSNSLTNLGGATAIGAFTSSMTSLSAATTYYVRAYATNDAGTVYGNEVSFTTLPEASAVTTQAVTDITINTATGNGTITKLGVPNLTAHGVVWSTTTNPTTSNSFTDLGGASAIGAFTSSMTSLSAATTYYVRAYATNDAGTVYGNEVSFTTLPEASAVTTQAVTDITINTATGNGTITKLGVPNPTAYGVVWSTTTNPTTSNSFTDLGGASAIGAFTSPLTSLSAATTYYVRAYATNAAGTVYGNEVSFTTLPEASAVITQAVTGIAITTATGNGTITSLGVPNPTAYGVVWSTSTNPTTSNSFTDLGGASAIGAFTSSMTSLSAATTYYVRAYATNAAGTVYGNEVSFTTLPEASAITTQAVTDITINTATGNGTITSLGVPNPTAYGVVWSTTTNPTTSNSFTDLGGATAIGAFTSSMSSLSAATTYYVRAYATNDAGTVYGNEVSFTTLPEASAITTQAVTDITINTATGNGTITSLGVPNPTAYGVVWSTTTNPTTSNSFTDLGGATAIGAFTSSMTSLSAGTTYYVRAYATNAAGTVYGNEVSFTTLPEASAVTTQAVTGIAITTATGNGTITSLGVPNPTAHGVVWSTTTNPTTSNSLTNLGGATSLGAYTTAMTSLSAGTTYYVRAYATNSAGTVYGEEVSFTTVFTLYTWTGNTSSDWATPSNWYPEIVPTTQDVRIPVDVPNFPIVSSTTSARCKDITVDLGATLTVTSDANNSGSLIFSGTYTGAKDVIYQRYMSGNHFHFIGSPLVGQTISSFLTNADNRIYLSAGIYSMMSHVESPEAWIANFTATKTGDINLGEGYNLKRYADGLVNFRGIPNNATIYKTITYDDNGWNFLSNPFTSSIAATSTANAYDNLLSTNTPTLDPSYTALYIWVEDPITNTNSYKAITQTGGDLNQHYIQVGQGFLVKSKIGGGSFEISREMQSHQPTVAFKSSRSNTPWTKIVLHAEINNAKASTHISFNENMSNGLDVGYDAGLLKSNPEFALYSRLVEDNGVDFEHQCLPLYNDELIVPIGLDAKAGDIVSFTANAINLSVENDVVLEDRLKNTFTNLSETGDDYTIQLASDISGTGRFYIHNTMKSTLDFTDLDIDAKVELYARPNHDQLIIRGVASPNTSVRIYSLVGAQVADIRLETAVENQLPFYEKEGIYIAQIVNEKGTFTQKFSWVK